MMASLDAETCREITVIKKAHLVCDFTHTVKMHGENSIKLVRHVYKVFLFFGD
jgi:hypothetical protein